MKIQTQIKQQIKVKERADYNSNIGSVQVSVCSATMDGGSGKGIFQGLGQQVGRGLAGGMGSNVQGGW